MTHAASLTRRLRKGNTVYTKRLVELGAPGDAVVKGGMKRQVVFVSSVQKELAEERLAVRDFVRGDPLLRRFFDVWLFEDQPASDRRADQIYLDRIDHCGLYIGLLGREYGVADGHATDMEVVR